MTSLQNLPFPQDSKHQKVLIGTLFNKFIKMYTYHQLSKSNSFAVAEVRRQGSRLRHQNYLRTSLSVQSREEGYLCWKRQLARNA